VLAGSLAQVPRYGGHTWFFLQYLLGFRRLGFDVVFVDRAGPGVGVSPAAADGFLREVLVPFGLEAGYALLCEGEQETLGMPRRELLARVNGAAAFINVMGFIREPDILAAARRRVFLDIDPGFPQMWSALGLADLFRGHDMFVTVGQNVGKPECEIPTCGLDWIPTRPPVALAEWPTAAGDRRFTTVGAWRGPNAPVVFAGKTYGLRAHEFRKFATLPMVTGRQFEVALDVHPDEAKDLALLRANRWSLLDPDVTSNPASYRAFIQGSGAEFAVAKNMYVEARSGWFSDRSVCYLASGKPVIAEDTGIRSLYPAGEGLLTYATLDEAVVAVEDVSADYVRHSRAARALAEETFDSDIVLPALLSRVAV